MKKQLRIHCFQHVPFEGPGVILDWAREKTHNFSTTKFFEDYSFPSPDEYDFLIVMGGPMSFDDFDKYNWLKPEIEFIRKTIESKKAVLGICLGAQLIVSSLGGIVKHGNRKEIGWFPVFFNKEPVKNSLYSFLPDSMTVFHWHGDTFEIPYGASHIAYSEAYTNQAFIYGNTIIGLQFHLEMTERSLSEMMKFGKDELIKEKFIRKNENILSNYEFIKENNKLMFQVLNTLENYIT